MQRGIAELLFIVIGLGGCQGDPAPVGGAPPEAASAPIVSIPEPPSWSFPAIVEAARARAPRNVDGRPFGKLGLAYLPDEIDRLQVSKMSVAELQRYADVVTHAYPDAAFGRVSIDCESVPLDVVNNTAIANIAYVSLHAVVPETRARAAACIERLLARMNDGGRG